MHTGDPTEEGEWSQTDPPADNRNPACRYAAESLRSKSKHHRHIAACYTFRIMTIQMNPVRTSSYPEEPVRVTIRRAIEAAFIEAVPMFSSRTWCSRGEIERVETSTADRAMPAPLPGDGLCQLQEVMGDAHQAPLLCHLLGLAQQHLPKPSRLFDLPEDGLH